MIVTKLMQWLIAGVLFLVVWGCLLADVLNLNPSQAYKTFILHLPIYLVLTFGLYSAGVVGYRTVTFNDCPEAAKELRQEIEEARQDLRKKGVDVDS